MRYQRIPLEEQLRKVRGNFLIHPEYAPSVIRAMGEMPLAACFDRSEEKEEVLYKELLHMLDVPPEREASLTYRYAAETIRAWKQKNDYDHLYLVNAAVFTLAQPFADAYEKWKEDKRRAENPS